MNPQDFEQQEKLQAAAERAEREHLPTGDSQVDAYRLVIRALKQPLPDALPAEFAQQVMSKLRARDEAAGVERWLTGFMLVVLAVAAAGFGLPPLAAALAQALRATAAQPISWPLIFLAVFGMAAAWLMDATFSTKRG